MITRAILLAALLSIAAFRVVRWLEPRALRRPWQAALYFGFTAAVFGAWLWVRSLGHGNAGAIGPVVQAIASSWTIAILACVVVGLPVGVLRALSRIGRKAAPADVDLERRRFLGGMAVPVVAVTTGASGTVAGLGPFTVRYEDVHVPGLPDALDGFRIGQITDIHVGDFIDPAYVAEAVEAMNQAGCHLQVMTGDLIDDLEELDATFAALDRCAAPHGMVAILGNHEIWRGRARVLAKYDEVAPRGRVRLLVDASERIEHDGAVLRVVGVDYPMGPGGKHRLPPEERDAIMRASAERAFAQAQPGETVLCLSHHPDFFPIAAARGAALTLAGHTHGGQFAVLGMPVFRFAYDFMLGRYRLGDAHLYVSGGTGHWLPWRVGVPTEVTILTLRARQAEA